MNNLENLLQQLTRWNAGAQFLFFLGQNIVVFAAALLFGAVMLRLRGQTGPKAQQKDWYIAAGTVLINTVVTQLGLVLWENGLVRLDYSASYRAVTDLLILFFAMDLLMYVFHLAIHHTFLYRYIHTLHHEAVNPGPIDLFVLHPLETAGFGALWLGLLLTGTFNAWAIVGYLVLNVVFGITGHLGSLPSATAGKGLLRYLGTARFHHAHHQNVRCNFGFYTSVWDRLFGTYSDNGV